MGLLGNKPMDQWVDEYGHSHQHPVNRFCHTIGIPLIALSLPLFVVAAIPFVVEAPFLSKSLWIVPASMFVVGWVFQFVGHAIEKEPPEFFKDWRFLFVGLRWWMKKTGL